MGYDVFIGNMLLPIPPEKIQLKVKNQNETISLINDGEVNILKEKALSETSFDVLLPNTKYPFARYKNGFLPAEYFIKRLKTLKASKQPFHFVISRQSPTGKRFHGTNLLMSLEDYTITDDSEELFDVMVSITLKEYKHYGTKTIKLPKRPTETPKVVEQRETTNAPKTGVVHKINEGETSWEVSKKYYGTDELKEAVAKASEKVYGGLKFGEKIKDYVTIPAKSTAEKLQKIIDEQKGRTG